MENCDVSAESREVCLLKPRVISLSVLQNLGPNRNGSVRPISSASWIHQEPCNKSFESWWIFRGLLCQTAVQEQMCVPFAEASKSLLSVTSERSDCPPKTRRVACLQCDPEAHWSVSKTTHLLIKFCSPLCFHTYEPRGLATQKRESLN